VAGAISVCSATALSCFPHSCKLLLAYFTAPLLVCAADSYAASLHSSASLHRTRSCSLRLPVESFFIVSVLTMAPSSVASDDSGNDVTAPGNSASSKRILLTAYRMASSLTLMQSKRMASVLLTLRSSRQTVTTQLLRCIQLPVATCSRSRVSVKSRWTRSRMPSRSAR
jgi:hypothetical protein